MTRISLVLVLGLLACSKKKEENRAPTAPGASADAAAPSAPPDAAAVEVDAPAADGSGSGSDAPPITGADAAKIEEQAAKSSPQLASCYERSMKSEAAKLKDVTSVDVRVTVAGGGKVDSVQYIGLPVGTKLEGCMNTVIRGWKMPDLKPGLYQFTLTPPS